MRTFILVDENNLVTCVANLECNLHKDKVDAGQQVHEVEDTGILIGDEYDPDTKTVTARPENYPQPTAEEQAEIQIQAEMRRLAVASLKAKGTLGKGFVDSKDVAEEAVSTETSEVSK